MGTATAGQRMAAGVVAATLLAACTYGAKDPGLLGRHQPSAPPAERTVAAGNPELPVVGEAVWTTGDGSSIDLRIALHALRRIEGGTVLDWSVTPIRGLNLLPGDRVPATVDLGLTEDCAGTGNTIMLVDAFDDRVYRPLTDGSHCLCSPLRSARRQLRIGETRLLQVTFPELPAAQKVIDIDLPTVPMFNQVPVTPVGKVPTRTNSTDLARQSTPVRALATTPPLRHPDHDQQFKILVNRVVGADRYTSIEWTVQSLTAGPGLGRTDQTPLARPVITEPTTIQPFALMSGGDLSTRPGLWASALRSPNQQVTMVANLPALPRFTGVVDVRFGDQPPMTALPVVRATDGSIRVGGPIDHSGRTWTYSEERPSDGWPPSAWPTPLPDPTQVDDYRAVIEALPG